MKVLAIVNPADRPAGRSVAKRLANGHGFLCVGLDDPLKRFVRRVFGLDIHQFADPGAYEARLLVLAESPWRPNSRWSTAWADLEKCGPFFLTELGAERSRMEYLRRWFHEHMFAAAGHSRLGMSDLPVSQPSPKVLVETLREATSEFRFDRVAEAYRVIDLVGGGGHGYMSSTGTWAYSKPGPDAHDRPGVEWAVIPDVTTSEAAIELHKRGAELMRVAEDEKDEAGPWPMLPIPWQCAIPHSGPEHRDWLVDSLATLWKTGALGAKSAEPPPRFT